MQQQMNEHKDQLAKHGERIQALQQEQQKQQQVAQKQEEQLSSLQEHLKQLSSLQWQQLQNLHRTPPPTPPLMLAQPKAAAGVSAAAASTFAAAAAGVSAAPVAALPKAPMLAEPPRFVFGSFSDSGHGDEDEEPGLDLAGRLTRGHRRRRLNTFIKAGLYTPKHLKPESGPKLNLVIHNRGRTRAWPVCLHSQAAKLVLGSGCHSTEVRAVVSDVHLDQGMQTRQAGARASAVASHCHGLTC